MYTFAPEPDVVPPTCKGIFKACLPDLAPDLETLVFTVFEQKESRSTLEELPIEEEKPKNEETTKEDTSVDKPEPTQV